MSEIWHFGKSRGKVSLILGLFLEAFKTDREWDVALHMFSEFFAVVKGDLQELTALRDLCRLSF